MTYKEFAEKHLTPPVAQRYLKNIRQQGHVEAATSSSYLDPDIYLWSAFNWRNTAEGRKYWCKFANDISDLYGIHEELHDDDNLNRDY